MHGRCVSAVVMSYAHTPLLYSHCSTGTRGARLLGGRVTHGSRDVSGGAGQGVTTQHLVHDLLRHTSSTNDRRVNKGGHGTLDEVVCVPAGCRWSPAFPTAAPGTTWVRVLCR